jgi:hypothetical protein
MEKVRRIFLLTCVLCLAVSTVLAQDVLTVAGGPETHKVILDNAQVRVLEVRIPPGQKIAMHSHPANVVYYVTDYKLKVRRLTVKPRYARAKPVQPAGPGQRPTPLRT